MDDAIAVLQASVTVHQVTSAGWRRRAEDAEAENVEFRERWATKAMQLHQATDKIAELLQANADLTGALKHAMAKIQKLEAAAAQPEGRKVADAAIGRIIGR